MIHDSINFSFGRLSVAKHFELKENVLIKPAQRPSSEKARPRSKNYLLQGLC